MKTLFRDRWDKKIAGVCGGLGFRLKVDPTILRLLAVILCIFTGVLPLLIIYTIAWLVIPLGPTTYIQYECKKLYRSTTDRKVAGVCAGLAELFKMDATVMRLIVVVLLLVTGVILFLITYLIASFIIPEKPSR